MSNLKPFTSSQSREKAVENGRKGGKASGVSKRLKKSLRKATQAALEGTYNLKDTDTGVTKTMTGTEAVALSIVLSAINSKSRHWSKAVQYVLQLTGEDKSVEESELITAHADLIKAKTAMLASNDEDGFGKLDELLAAMRDLSYEDNTSDNTKGNEK